MLGTGCICRLRLLNRARQRRPVEQAAGWQVQSPAAAGELPSSDALSGAIQISEYLFSIESDAGDVIRPALALQSRCSSWAGQSAVTVLRVEVHWSNTSRLRIKSTPEYFLTVGGLA